MENIHLLDTTSFLPASVANLGANQSDIPRIAKDKRLIVEIENAVQRIPTMHQMFLRDARRMSFVKPESVHLIVTSPPYWTLKKYRDSEGQLGDIAEYGLFLKELDKVWRHCYRVLVPGGRLVCVV